MRSKHVVSSLVALKLAHNKKKLFKKTLGNRSRDMLNFKFLEKGLGLVSPCFVYDFSRKMFPML